MRHFSAICTPFAEATGPKTPLAGTAAQERTLVLVSVLGGAGSPIRQRNGRLWSALLSFLSLSVSHRDAVLVVSCSRRAISRPAGSAPCACLVGFCARGIMCASQEGPRPKPYRKSHHRITKIRTKPPSHGRSIYDSIYKYLAHERPPPEPPRSWIWRCSITNASRSLTLTFAVVSIPISRSALTTGG